MKVYVQLDTPAWPTPSGYPVQKTRDGFVGLETKEDAHEIDVNALPVVINDVCKQMNGRLAIRGFLLVPDRTETSRLA